MAQTRRRYRVQARQPDGDWGKPSRPLVFSHAIEHVDELTKERTGELRIDLDPRPEHRDWGQWLQRDELHRQMRRRLSKLDTGDYILVDRSRHGLEMLRVKAVRIDAHRDPVPRGYNPRVRSCMRFLNGHFEGWENWGVCNCRYIAGTTSWSQHAWCNAIDIHFDTMGQMDRVAAGLKSHAGALDARAILWRGRSVLTGNPVDDHFDHVHIEFNPLDPGTRCA